MRGQPSPTADYLTTSTMFASLGGIIPVQMSDSALSLFLRVRSSRRRIQSEVGVRAGIDTHLGDFLDLIGALDWPFS